jgi:hypothetical protein
VNLKKVISSFLLSSVIVITSSITAFATPVDNIRAALIRGGVPADQVSKAIEYVQRYEITDEQANAIIAKINAAAAKMNGQKDFSKVPPELRMAILADVAEAMSYLGLKADYSTKNEKGATELQVTDTDGKKVASGDYSTTKTMTNNLNVEAIKEAVVEAKNLSQSTEAATFEPVSEGVLKKTGTNYGNLMLLGLSLMLTGGAATVYGNKTLERRHKGKGGRNYAETQRP